MHKETDKWFFTFFKGKINKSKKRLQRPISSLIEESNTDKISKSDLNSANISQKELTYSLDITEPTTSGTQFQSQINADTQLIVS